MLRRHGLVDVELRSWPEARHEILNETNRDEVMNYMEVWLEKHRRSA
jgi:alpha-beta hydrolase superfamily lysophospholipase